MNKEQCHHHFNYPIHLKEPPQDSLCIFCGKVTWHEFMTPVPNPNRDWAKVYARMDK